MTTQQIQEKIEVLFIRLKILQIVSNQQRHKDGLKRLGNGHFEASRLNPYNPLSYILVLVITILLLLMYGFVGLFNEAKNPFLWE